MELRYQEFATAVSDLQRVGFPVEQPARRLHGCSSAAGV
jgi:hypothetical protein